MKSFKKFSLFSSALVLGLALTACNDDEVSDTDSGGETSSGGTAGGSGGNGNGAGGNGTGGNGTGTGGGDSTTQTIVKIASEDDRFSTLVAAVTKAGLVDALGGDNLTVFAPTNDAFAALLTKIGATSLADLSAAQLKPILLYHVLGMEVDSTAAIAAAPGDAKTASLGGTLDLSLDGDKLKVDKATVTTADIQASNGIIHVIDQVLLPSITDIVTTDASLMGLKGLVLAADGVAATTPKVAAALDGPAPSAGAWTLFAPSNEAVSGIPAPAPSGQDLTNVLLYHVHPAAAPVTAETALGLTNASIPTALPTKNITVNGGNSVTVTGVAGGTHTVEVADIWAENGIIHIIDGVLLPQ